MKLAPILLIKFKNGAEKTSNSSFQKICWPPNSSELNPLDYSIWDIISNHVEYHKVKTINDLCRKVEKAMKQVDINYVREVIGAFFRRVYSVENHAGELIINEHS